MVIAEVMPTRAYVVRTKESNLNESMVVVCQRGKDEDCRRRADLAVVNMRQCEIHATIWVDTHQLAVFETSVSLDYGFRTL